MLLTHTHTHTHTHTLTSHTHTHRSRQRNCKYCYHVHKNRRLTSTYCKGCNAPLCKQCLRKWHDWLKSNPVEVRLVGYVTYVCLYVCCTCMSNMFTCVVCSRSERDPQERCPLGRARALARPPAVPSLRPPAIPADASISIHEPRYVRPPPVRHHPV